MTSGVHIIIPRPPVTGRVIYESLLAAPDRLADIGTLQTNVSQQVVVQLAQLPFGFVARNKRLQLAHQARRSRKAVVANGFAAHGNRRHLLVLRSSGQYLCVAQFQASSNGGAAPQQAKVAHKSHANYAWKRSYIFHHHRTRDRKKYVDIVSFCDRKGSMKASETTSITA
jgi:hypothetical protein